MNFRIILLGLCNLLLTTGCANFIKPPETLYKETKTSQKTVFRTVPEHFETLGKVGFSDGQAGGNANIVWEQYPQQYQIRLYGPFGNGAVQIQGYAQHVVLTDADGKKTEAKTPEILVKKALGVAIPVSDLRYWLRGLPAPGTLPTLIVRDENHRLWEIKQQGWHVQYQDYQQTAGVEVPHRLSLNYGAIRLKFVFYKWKFN